MNAKQNALAKPSEPEKVDACMQGLKHPLADVVEALRRIILSTDREIGEEVKWNAPTFFYAGEMKSFNPKDPQWITRNMLAWMFTETVSIAVVDSTAKLVKESILETKASTILEFILALRRNVQVRSHPSHESDQGSPRSRGACGVRCGTSPRHASQSSGADARDAGPACHSGSGKASRLSLLSCASGDR